MSLLVNGARKTSSVLIRFNGSTVTNRMHNGMGNGVRAIVNNTSVRLHACWEGTQIEARELSSAAEINIEIERVDQVRRRFLQPNGELDDLSMLINECIDQAIRLIKGTDQNSKTDVLISKGLNAEAAIERVVEEFVKGQEVVVKSIEEEIRKRDDEIISRSKSMPKDKKARGAMYESLRALDEQNFAQTKNLTRKKALIEDINTWLKRVVHFLEIGCQETSGETSETSGIHVADILTWPEMSNLFSQGAQGFILCSDYLGPINHPFIYAHQDNIPLVVMQNPLEHIGVSTRVSIDSRTGQIIVNPTETTVSALERRAAGYKRLEKLFKTHKEMNKSLDGKPLPDIQRNIRNADGLKGENIGLFRLEGVYVKSYPGGPTLVRIAKKVIAKSKIVNFRLLDLDEDKSLILFDKEKIDEDTKALFDQETNDEDIKKKKGIDFLLNSKIGRTILRQQIKAILIAYDRLKKDRNVDIAEKTVRILLPMIINSEEVGKVKDMIAKIEQKLLVNGKIEEKVSGQIEISIMVETASAITNIESLAKECKCKSFSIGGNDATIELLRIDKRKKLMTGKRYDWLSPIVLRNIKKIIDFAKANEISVGFCGEMARDPLGAIILTLMGIDSLSMDNSYRSEINYILSNIYIDEWIKFARKDKAGVSPIDKTLKKLGLDLSGGEELSVIDTILNLKDALEVRKFLFELITKHTHADTRLALQDVISSPIPVTYQEKEE